MPIVPWTPASTRRAMGAGGAGAEYVINRYRNPDQNLRTTFRKIVLRAGLVPWGKPFQNMRASRSTELVDSFPSHVAAGWLGHSPAIAEKHYRMIHDEHFEKAIRMGEAERNAERAASAGGGIEWRGEAGEAGVDHRNHLLSNDLQSHAKQCAQKKPSAYAELMPP